MHPWRSVLSFVHVGQRLSAIVLTGSVLLNPICLSTEAAFFDVPSCPDSPERTEILFQDSTAHAGPAWSVCLPAGLSPPRERGQVLTRLICEPLGSQSYSTVQCSPTAPSHHVASASELDMGVTPEATIPQKGAGVGSLLLGDGFERCRLRCENFGKP